MGTMHEVGYWKGADQRESPCKPQSQYGIAKNALRQSLMPDGSPCKLHWLRADDITGAADGSSIFAKLAQAETACAKRPSRSPAAKTSMTSSM